MISEVKKNTDTPVVYYIVGNKTDLKRTVTHDEANEFASSVNSYYWETSVYSNSGKFLLTFNINLKEF